MNDEQDTSDHSASNATAINNMVPMVAPIDASLRRGNPRQPVRGPTLRDTELMQSVTPTLRGENITSMAVDDETKAYLSPAATALDTLYVSVQQIIEARNTVAKNSTWSEGQQIVQVADYADKLQARALKVAQKASEDLGRAIAGTEEMLRAPITTGAQTPIASDICTYCRSLSQADRLAFLSEAVKSKDVVTLGAVLGRPAYLSGINKEMQATLTEQFHRAKTPDVARRLEAMKEARSKLDNAGSLFILTVEQAQGVRPAVTQRLRAEQAAALKALS